MEAFVIGKCPLSDVVRKMIDTPKDVRTIMPREVEVG